MACWSLEVNEEEEWAAGLASEAVGVGPSRGASGHGEGKMANSPCTLQGITNRVFNNAVG